MKVFLDSIGCRLNQSEIEKLGKQFREAGHELVSSADTADLVVVNTCVVTAAAAADSRKQIRHAARAGNARIVATGCYATIDPQTVADLPSVEKVFSNAEKDDLVSQVTGNALLDQGQLTARIPLPGNHKRTRAFIKVQDGCDNFCTFCITRIARGKSRSIPREEIFRDVEAALAGGVKEIVLTGVNLGSWGRECEEQDSLGTLIGQVFRMFHPPRLRLSSLEPWDIDGDILHALKLPGFCQHLHLPLQSGSDAVLRVMGRRINQQNYEATIKKIRAVSPDIALTTDIMVGFPGETDEFFEESLAFVRRMNFSGGHIFSYSLRPGTPAESLPNPVTPALIKNRSRRMRELIALSSSRYREDFLGHQFDVLWERSEYLGGQWELSGLTSNNLSVKCRAGEDLNNRISKVS
ncbi:MAG: tRNA (N(6)-L-threonylcarbamoyladenosine(37)-C(2))-methylthiotransferase MtaB, partial [Chloroflexi bacterium]|nr:tRNA (N(6)-L-threonylcarbamoyladenosine(37)-C(2))-methylthiotransferase MtaB [Chloroflexota bacterium]